MPRKAKNEITKLEVREMSLVDDPDNPHAHVAFFKARTESGHDGGGSTLAGALGDQGFEASLAPEVRQHFTKFKTLYDAESVAVAALLADGAVLNKAAKLQARAALFKAEADETINVLGEVGEDAEADDDAEMAKAALTVAALIEDHVMNIEQLTKAVADAEAKLASVTTDLEKARADNAALTTELEKSKEKVVELEKAKPADGENADEVMLKSLPEALRVSILKDREQAAADRAITKALIEEGEVTKSITKAKEIGFGEADKIGPVLHRIAKGATKPEDAAVIETVLKSAAEIAKTSKLLKSAGATEIDLGGQEPEEVVKAKVAELRKARPELTAEAAYDEVLKAEPQLYTAMVAKRRSA